MDKQEIEYKARQKALSVLGDYVTEIGIDKPIGNYSKPEIEGLIHAVLTGYQDELQEIYKREIPF